MKTLEIPDQAHRDALRSAVNVARRLGLSKEDLYVGAGTSLVMRWEHRPFTGIWVFILPRRARTHHCEIEEIQKAIEDESGTQVLADYDWSQWIHSGILVGLHATTSHSVPIGQENEASTGLPLETPSSAFRKKLVQRIHATGDIIVRDALDMLEFHRKEPEALRELLDTFSNAPRICAQECRFQAAAEPAESLKPLWQDMATLFEGMPLAPVPRHKVEPSLLAPQLRKKIHINPLADIQILPDEAFSHPLFSAREKFNERLLRHASPSMAGHPLSPSPQEIHSWLTVERRENLPDNAESYMCEFLKQIYGTRLFALRQGSGASLRKLARMARWTDFMMSGRLKTGINRLPSLHASGDRTEGLRPYQPNMGFQA